MQTALVIVLGLLVVAAVAMQVWMARAAGGTGVKSGTVVAIRIFNAVMLLAAVAIAIYAIARR